MNILFIETSLNPNMGGIERVTYTLSKELTKCGFLCFFAFYDVDYKEIPQRMKLRISNKDKQRDFDEKLISFIKNNNIYVIVNQDIYSNKVMRFYKRHKRNLCVKLINCFHLSPNFYEYKKVSGWKFKLKCWIYSNLFKENWFVHERKQMYRLCDKFVLLSNSFLHDFAERYKLSSCDKLASISNPLPYNDNEYVDVTNKQKIVLIVSRFFETQKNIKASLRIWKELQNKGFLDWKLEIVGYGQDEEMLKQFATEIGLINYEFMGQSSNVEDYYRKSSLFMMTSNYEGFGMTILEAQHFGCIPVVIDNFTVAHDLIDNGRNGFLVKDETSFVELMTNLLNSPVKLLSLYENCMLSSSTFTSEVICKKWTLLFKQL